MTDKYQSIVSLKDDIINNIQPQELKLFIECSLDGFTYALLWTEKNKFITLESYKFLHYKDFETLSFRLNELLLKLNITEKSYLSSFIIYRGIKFTHIPAEVFDESLAESYFCVHNDFNKTQELLSYDKLNNLNAYVIYAKPKVYDNTLRKHFPNAIFRHHSTELIENLIYQNKKDERKIYFHFQNNYIDIIIIKGKELLFFNTFSYKAPEDVLFFTLNVFNQLQINPLQAEITVLGEIAKNSNEIQLLKNYFAHIIYGERSDNFHYCDAFEEIPKHYYFNLLNFHL